MSHLIMSRKPTGNQNGRPLFKPTNDDRKTVSLMASVGIPHEGIALCIRDGIDDKTLRKHFKNELATAAIKANTKIAGKMYRSALNGNMFIAKWWSQARMGWTETRNLDLNVKNGVLVTPADITPEQWIADQEKANTDRTAQREKKDKS